MKLQVLRCPRCSQFIVESDEVCRFCNSRVTKEEREAALALQNKVTQQKAKSNDRQALIYAVVTLLALVAWFVLRFALRFAQ